eukprot:TRINITY_DN93812_c0_g1_i1.p1 TRINITY_DN93812_c0_g1~~TRINITY_DN93812_c0_g1_i1.p1  ORF type:complete len:619 (-),score=131.20 TRINITY_DN93812_c0_g1_i1:156-2012(-)
MAASNGHGHAVARTVADATGPPRRLEPEDSEGEDESVDSEEDSGPCLQPRQRRILVTIGSSVVGLAALVGLVGLVTQRLGPEQATSSQASASLPPAPLHPVRTTGPQQPTLQESDLAPKEGCCTLDAVDCKACVEGNSIAEYCKAESSAPPECDCKTAENETDYPGGDLYVLDDISSPQYCCWKCQEEPRCKAWTYAWPSRCALKAPLEIRREDKAPGKTSGLPGHRDTQLVQLRLPNAGLCGELLAEAGTTGIHLHNCDNTATNPLQFFLYDRYSMKLRSEGDLCFAAPVNDSDIMYLQPCEAEDESQKWRFSDNGLIVSKLTGSCLSAPPSLHLSASKGHKVVPAPCSPDDHHQQWSMWIVNPPEKNIESDGGGITAFRRARRVSLYCVALMMPWGSELALMKMQWEGKRSIFGCDGYDVYSNVVVNLGGFHTKIVYTEMHAEYGMIFGAWSASNTPIFQQFWKQLITDGRYKKYDWTVKLDPDCVFFPDRLHDLIWADHSKEAALKTGILMNNCRYNFHGPIEVLSKHALDVYGNVSEGCTYYAQEDMYLFECLKNAGVTVVDEFDRLLAENHCDTATWHDCTLPRVAFHPFKKPDEYEACIKRSERAFTALEKK